MSAPANHWKLGLFVVVGFCLAAIAVVYLGARSLQKETVLYKTYFDESVQGLELGSPVKFRGVTLGSVAKIDVAADHRHVEVSCDLNVKELLGLGLSDRKHVGLRTKLSVPPELRVRLETTGITGVKFLLIDYFNPETHPPPTLPFPTPDNYIPSTPSLIKNIEDSVVHALDKLPDMAAQIQKLMPAALLALEHADLVLMDAHKAIGELQVGKLSGQAESALVKLNVALTNINKLVESVNGDKGLLASLRRTSDAVGNTAQNATYVGPTLEATLREIQGAAESVHRLADSIDRDPDMLLKGRAKQKGR